MTGGDLSSPSQLPQTSRGVQYTPTGAGYSYYKQAGKIEAARKGGTPLTGRDFEDPTAVETLRMLLQGDNRKANSTVGRLIEALRKAGIGTRREE